MPVKIRPTLFFLISGALLLSLLLSTGTSLASQLTTQAATQVTETAIQATQAAAQTTQAAAQTTQAAAQTTQEAAQTAVQESGNKEVKQVVAASQRINVNQATAEQLTSLPGIGSTRAQAIIEHRNQHGRFQNLNDIQQVSGIGPAILGRIEPYVAF